MEEIKIDWMGPYKIDEITQKKKKLFREEKGLYQIYGYHPLYGNDVLLYIGKTANQTFSKRLKDRYEVEYSSDIYNTKIYLGVIISDNKNLKDNEKIMHIGKAEALLINALKPAYNSFNVKSVNKELAQENFIVYNEGNYRSIYPILSSEYFWKNWKNYELIDRIAKDLYGTTPTYDKKSREYAFHIDEDEDIWLSINEKIWENYGYPLQIAIPKENEEAIKKLDPVGEEEDEYLYINALDDLNAPDAVEKIKKRIELIKKKLKSIGH